MWLKFERARDRARFLRQLSRILPTSRFTIGRVECRVAKGIPDGVGLCLTAVRLWRKKDYCGQHPGECLLEGNPHRYGSWLEGSDWVGFNDMLNLIADRLKLTVDIWSYNREYIGSKYWIRRGTSRRVSYVEDWIRGFRVWAEDDPFDFVDCRGLRVSSIPETYVTENTPGIPHWRRSAEKKYKELFV